jgi:predicted outer membrane repeat protein
VNRLVTAGLATVLATGVGVAGAQTTTTEGPTTTAVPTTVSPAPSATVEADDADEFLAALEAASSDPSGPHTIELGDHFSLALGFDPTYTGTEPLTIVGNEFSHEMEGRNRFLRIDTNATVTIRDVWAYDGNAGSGDGGAVLSTGTGTVEIVSSTFARNRASGDGGALAAPDGTLLVTQSLLSDNHAHRGGAIAIGDGGLVSSTVAWNHADEGGGVYVPDGDVRAVHATIAENHAPVGANVAAEPAGTLSLLATALVAPLGGGANCRLPGGGTDDHAFADDDSCDLGDTSILEMDGPDPLGPLQGYGTFTGAMAPNPGSILVDAIDPSEPYAGPGGTCAGFPDQDGQARPVEGDGRAPAWCDIGAIELTWHPPTTPPDGPIAGPPDYTG